MDIAVEFDTELFRPWLPESAQVNPGCYGAELAFWLSRKLAEHGVMTSYPIAEDWGWLLEYTADGGGEYWLCCGNEEDTTDRWRCWLEPKAMRLFGRNKAPVAGAAPLMQALRELLAREQGIHHIVWREQA